MEQVSNFFANYWKTILATVVVAVLIGGIGTVLANQSKSKEQKIQESYYSIEKKLQELKARAATQPEKDKKAEPVDFTEIKKELTDFIAAHTGSIAAQMAGLHLAQLQLEAAQSADALATLQKVENNDKGLVNTLVQQQVAQLLAGQDKCQDAIATWQKILDRKDATFLHSEIKLQQALCFAKMNDMKKAEEILTNLSTQTANPDIGESTVSKEAEKYLRLMHFKKTSGT